MTDQPGSIIPPVDPDSDAITVARQLVTALGKVQESVDAVRTDSEERDADLAEAAEKNRRMIWVSLISVSLDILLTVGFAIALTVAVHATNRADSASAEAAQTRAATIISCQSTNTARAQNEQLWTYVLSLFAPRPGETAAQKAQGEKLLTQLSARVNTAFAPRDCTALLYKGGKS